MLAGVSGVSAGITWTNPISLPVIAIVASIVAVSGIR